jgi:hypothetical protein
VTARQIIGEVVALPPAERAEVIRFACRLDGQRLLNGEELTALAEQLTEAGNSPRAAVLREDIERGFYGR